MYIPDSNKLLKKSTFSTLSSLPISQKKPSTMLTSKELQEPKQLILTALVLNLRNVCATHKVTFTVGLTSTTLPRLQIYLIPIFRTKFSVTHPFIIISYRHRAETTKSGTWFRAVI